MAVVTDHVGRNRARWDAISESYQATNAPQIDRQAETGDITWGVWGLPESQLGVLGAVDGRDVLEMGCGAGQWSMALARRGARPVGLDLSGAQLARAARLMDDAGLSFPLVQASAEAVPFADGSFDVVFADHGAFTFADPYRTIPEAARVLRPGGLLAFCRSSPIVDLAWPLDEDHPSDRLVRDYFGMHRIDDPDGMVEFQLTYGEWIRVLRASGLIVEDLIEPRPAPDAVSTYRDAIDRDWHRRWPGECIWRLRKPGADAVARG